MIDLFIFRRDFRIDDNLAFIDLLQSSKRKILPVFIFNPYQIDKSSNKYYNNNAIQFMIQCLKELNSTLNNSLCYMYGNDIDILHDLHKKFTLNTIAFNSDYTPFARQRDSTIIQWCKKQNINILTRNDYNLLEFDKIKTKTGNVYQVFTPFYRNVINIIDDTLKPYYYNDNIAKQLIHIKGNIQNIDKFYIKNNFVTITGGRNNALDILKKIKKGEFKSYDTNRNFPALDKTTKLSAYIKFGCVSMREVLWVMINTYGKNHGLVRELLWREFYSYITFNFPTILKGQLRGKNEAFKEKYNNVQWKYSETKWNAWCNGTTGVPFVDAAMRQMNKTGWMPNRCRMIVAVFLTKSLLIDWRLGEQYFACNLTDYDPSSNNGGWQWSSSTGVDSQPYFRSFNPYLQSQKYDPKCEYIKKWIPELNDIPSANIHNWNKEYINYKVYQQPIVDTKVEFIKFKQMFLNINNISI